VNKDWIDQAMERWSAISLKLDAEPSQGFERMGRSPLKLRPPLVDTLDCATMDPYREANRRLWEEWAAIHRRAEFYRVEHFKRGRDPLKPFEVEELGDVAGQTLLHLQCHFGLDTLSWARLGATVTGSPQAQSITFAGGFVIAGVVYWALERRVSTAVPIG